LSGGWISQLFSPEILPWSTMTTARAQADARADVAVSKSSAANEPELRPWMASGVGGTPASMRLKNNLHHRTMSPRWLAL
jgi:hypothetical protein